MIEFLKVRPENIPYLPFKAVKFLEEAIKRTPASTSNLAVTLEIAAKGYGDIYLIARDDEIIGATYLIVYPTPEEKILGIILLGGDNIASWILDYRKFIREYMDLTGINRVMFIGRKGWAKLFPDSKVIGYVCEITK